MEWSFDITLKNRIILKGFIDTLSLEELNKIPTGYSNNIIWNIAHTIVTQQILVYSLSGLKPQLDDKMIAQYRKDTRPEIAVDLEAVDEIKGLLLSTIEKTKSDFNLGVFKSYNSYTVSTKSTLTNVREAIEFNNFHEGIHLGYILALKKSL